MIRFYKSELLAYYNEFKSKQTIAGKKLSPELIQKYNSLSKAEFCYGLIHHDGVGNAVSGNDRQGVQIARSRFTTSA